MHTYILILYPCQPTLPLLLLLSPFSSSFVPFLSFPHPVLATLCYNPRVFRGGWRVSCARLISSIIAHPLYILYPFLKHHHDGSTSTFYRITGNRRYGVQLGEVKNEKPVVRDGIYILSLWKYKNVADKSINNF